MNLCACGITAEDGGTLCSRCAALHVLELRAGASEREIKAAYRMLVKVWHPDRFQGDKVLKDAADVKLKSINTAYIFLTSAPTMGERRKPAPKGKPATNRPQTNKEAPAAHSPRSTFRWFGPTLKILFRFVVVLAAILMGRYLWIAFDLQNLTREATTVFGNGKDSVLNGLETPKRRFLSALQEDLRRLDPRIPAPAVLTHSEEAATATNTQTGQKANGRLQSRIATRKISPYITLGSTQEEVLAQLGTPTAALENKFVYGKSELYFKNDNVVGWRIDPVSSPIRVKIWPESPVDASLKYFTVGSSKDVVLAVQGTPTALSEDKFGYGGSEIYFQNNRVVRWKNDPASIQLRSKPY